MSQPSEFLRPAEKLPLLFQLSHFHLVKSVSYTDTFIKIVRDSQVLLNDSSSFLWQVHTTHQNMLSVFNAMCTAVDSHNAKLSAALSAEIQQWVRELLEELSGLRERWKIFDATLTEIWTRTTKAKNQVIQGDTKVIINAFMEMHADLHLHLKAASQSLGEAASIPQDILCFLQAIHTQLQAHKQEWRKIQILLTYQDHGIQQSIKQAQQKWHTLSSQCVMVKQEFDKRGINDIYKLVLHRDPQDLTNEQWKVAKENILVRISQLNK